MGSRSFYAAAAGVDRRQPETAYDCIWKSRYDAVRHARPTLCRPTLCVRTIRSGPDVLARLLAAPQASAHATLTPCRSFHSHAHHSHSCHSLRRNFRRVLTYWEKPVMAKRLQDLLEEHVAARK